MNGDRLRRFYQLVPPLAALLVFLPTVFNGFVNWDDDIYILRNPLLQDFSWQSLKAIFGGFYAHYYAPLTFLTYAAEYKLAGPAPWLYHLDNILLHAVNVWLAYRFLMLLCERPKVALLGATLLAVHPLRVESVAWVTERKDLLYSLFYLLSMNAYLRYARQGLRTAELALSAFFCLLSLLCKPMAVTLPAALLIIDFHIKRRFSWRLLAEKLPHAALAAAFAFLTWLAQGHSTTGSGNLIANAETALSNVYFYLGKILLPMNLSALYPPPTYALGLRNPLWFTIQVTAALGALYACWLLRRKMRVLATGLLFFLVTLSPVIQVVSIGWSGAADRYTYMPSLGIALILAAGAAALYGKLQKDGRKYMLAGVVIALAALSAASLARCFAWRDSITLWTDVLRNYPESAIALNNRGKAYAQAGDFAKAETDFTAALRTHPESVIFLSNRASASARLGHLETALQDLDKAIALVPDAPSAYNNRGAIYLLSGRPRHATHDFQKALELQPGYQDAAHNLATAQKMLRSKTINK